MLIFRKLIPVFLAGGLLASSVPSKTVVPTPAVTVMPWQAPGISYEEQARFKVMMATGMQALVDAFVRNPQPLAAITPARRLAENTKIMARKIITGEAQLPSARAPLVIEPVWCSLNDYYVFFLQVGAADTDTLLISKHQAVAKQEFAAAMTDPKQQATLAASMGRLITEVGAAMSSLSKAPAKNALQVALALGQESTRADRGSHHCLNLLVGEKLLTEDLLLIRGLGGENFQGERYVTGNENGRLRRATRKITNSWQADSQDFRQPNRRLPARYTLNTNFSEGVFGDRISRGVAAKYEFRAADGKITFALDDNIRNFCKQEAGALSLADLPQVAKVYGAWVYVDRGRGYGLKINDRVVVESAPSEIQGHVVGFFGPSMKLQSPRGYPIHEGAIVYIRKGQKQTKIGQLLSFDNKKFPTPWPPPGK